MELFKYCGFDLRAQSVLMSRNVWYSKRSTLNDPYDCRPQIEFDMKEEQFEDFMKPKGIEVQGEPLRREIKEKMMDLVSEEFLDNIGVYCLSKDPLNELMWAHYANNHRGIMIGWDVGDGRAKDASENHMGARRMEYEGRGSLKMSEFYECYSLLTQEDPDHESKTKGSDLLMKIIDACYLRKSPPWAYEKEIRFINQKRSGATFFNASIASVTYGCHFDKETKPQVQVALGNGIEEYQMELGASGLKRHKVQKSTA